MKGFFLLALLAHLVGDFVLQPTAINNRKEEGKISGFLLHGLILFLLTFLAVHWYGLLTALLYGVLVTAAHLLLDLGKYLAGRRGKPGAELFLFLIDQLFHLAVVFFSIYRFIPVAPDPGILGFYARILPGDAIPALAAGLPGAEERLVRGLQVAVVYTATLFGGAILIQKTLHWLTGKTSLTDGHLGRAVGILERLILLTLVAAESLPALGFILAAKSIARYQELNNRDFAEYYLVGTLASFSLAFFAGLWLRTLLKI